MCFDVQILSQDSSFAWYLVCTLVPVSVHCLVTPYSFQPKYICLVLIDFGPHHTSWNQLMISTKVLMYCFECSQCFKAAVPNFFVTRDRFVEDSFSIEGGEGWFQDNSYTLHLLLYFYYYYIIMYNEVIIQVIIMQNQQES